MELSVFIKDTIIGIAKGIDSARDELQDSNCIIVPKAESSNDISKMVTNIEFDIALGVNETEGAQGGVGLMIASIGLGGKVSSNISSENVSRIKFQIPIVLPQDKRGKFGRE